METRFHEDDTKDPHPVHFKPIRFGCVFIETIDKCSKCKNDAAQQARALHNSVTT